MRGSDYERFGGVIAVGTTEGLWSVRRSDYERFGGAIAIGAAEGVRPLRGSMCKSFGVKVRTFSELYKRSVRREC